MEEDKYVYLGKGLNMRDLMGGSGAVFEISEDREEGDESSLQMPSSEDFLKSINANHALGDDELDEILFGPAGLVSFSALEAKMTNLTDDGSVKKVIIRQGIGAVVPPKALVDVHYQGYFELADEPFDSTYLRGRPERLALQAGVCLPGLEIALSSMKKKELSRFLVKPNMAYGALGVQPRIRPNAEVLFEIELLSFIDGIEAEAMAAIEHESSKCFATVYKAAELKYFEGNEFYQRNNFSLAITKYQKVRSLLEFANLADAHDEEKQQKFLLKIYTNLAICYNKLASPCKACTMSQLALKIDPGYCKALFAYGRALLMLHEHQQAIMWLNKARQVRPLDTEISQELRKAYTSQRESKALERQSCARMFSQSSPQETEEQESQDMADFKVEAKLILEEFCKLDATSQVMPAGMTQWETNIIKTAALKLGLLLEENEDKSVTIKKPK